MNVFPNCKDLFSFLDCTGLVVGRGYFFDGCMQAAYRFVFTDDFGDVEHVRAAAFSDNGQTEGVHHISHVVAVLLNPGNDNRFGSRRAEIFDSRKQLDELLHDDGGIGFPTFLIAFGSYVSGAM